MKRTLPLVFAGLLSVLVLPAGAVEAEGPTADDLLFMDIPVVITASKKEQSIIESPSTIEVYDGTLINALGLQTLADLLRLTSGVDIYFGEDGRKEHIGIRGVGSSGSVLLMVDNIILNHPNEGYGDLNELVSIHNVKRIEIIRGPGSALYGAYAFAGIIHIITKDFADRVDGRVTYSYGNFDSHRANAFYNSSRLQSEVCFYNSDGYAGNRINRVDRANNLSLNAKGSITDNLIMEANYSNMDRWRPGNTHTPLMNTKNSIDQGYVGMRYEKALSERTLLASHVNYSLARDDYSNEGALVNIDEERGVGDMTFYYNPSTVHSLLFGAEYRTEAVTSGLFLSDHKRRTGNIAISIQDELTFHNGLQITLGTRHDQHSVYGGELSPRISTVYKVTRRTTVKASIGHAFRAPTFDNLYVNALVNPVVHVSGNEHLNPERLSTIELGVLTRPTDELQLDANMFRSDVRDLVSSAVTITPYPYLIQVDKINKDKAEIQGGEIAVSYKHGGDGFLVLNYSYQHARDHVTGARLLDIPENKGNLVCGKMVRVPINATYTLAAHYVGRRRPSLDVDKEADSFIVISVNAGLDIGKNMTLTVGVDNLADKDYEEQALSPRPGRTFRTGLEYRM